jgi:hypothetical protein
MRKPAPKRIPISEQATFTPSATPMPGRPAELLPLATQVVALGAKLLFALVALVIGGIGLGLTHAAASRVAPILFLAMVLLAGYFLITTFIKLLNLYPQLRAVQRAWEASKAAAQNPEGE